MLLNKKSSFVATGGICAALSLLMLFVASTFPFCRLAFVFAASLIVGVLIVTYGYKLAVVQYAAVAILALLILPNKSIAVLYAVVVGNYPVVKRIIDRVQRPTANLAIKLVVFNIYMVVCCGIAVLLLNINMSVAYPWWILWIGMLAVFYVYDYIYMLFIGKAYDLIIKR